VHQTRRYYLRKGTPLEADKVGELGETNCGDPKVLADFIKWSVKNYPAQHYLLVLWNHGAGWDDTNVYRLARHGMQRTVTRRGDVAVRGGDGEAVSVRRIRVVGGRKFRRALFSTTVAAAISSRGIAYDDNAQDFLDNLEVKRVLSAASRSLKRKIDILGMDACLMSMAEVSYQLRGSVDFTVGSEEVEPGDGWPYHTILRDLVRRPEMTPRDLSAIIVKRYLESYRADSEVTQSACDLAKSEALAKAVNALAKALLAVLGETTSRVSLLAARAQAQSYEKPEYVDLRDLCDLLAVHCRDAAIATATAKVRAALQEDGFVVANGSRGGKVAHSHGVAIYFPERPPISPLYATLDFTKSTKWDEFLVAFLEAMTRREPVAPPPRAKVARSNSSRQTRHPFPPS